MNVNIAINQLQVTTVKNTAAEIAAIRQWLVIKRQLGLMANHLKEIGQDLEQNLKSGESWFLKGIITLANIATLKNIYKPITLLNGQKMKVKDLNLATDLLCVWIATAKFTAENSDTACAS